jgi:hypothetical protein
MTTAFALRAVDRPGSVAAVLALERRAGSSGRSSRWRSARLSAWRKVRLKCRRLSGPTRRMPVYLWTSASTACLPFGSMGQLQLLAEDLGQLVERHVDLEDVLPGVLARLAFAPSPSGDLARLPLALTDAHPLTGAVGEPGQLDLRQGDAHDVLPLAADHLAVRDVASQVLPDPAPDDLPEPVRVLIDSLDHVASATPQLLLLNVAAGEDRGHVVEHVGGADLAVSVVPGSAGS